MAEPSPCRRVGSFVDPKTGGKPVKAIYKREEVFKGKRAETAGGRRDGGAPARPQLPRTGRWIEPPGGGRYLLLYRSRAGTSDAALSDPRTKFRLMEVIWFGIAFLIGVVLWMPFIIDARLDVKLARVGLLPDRVGR